MTLKKLPLAIQTFAKIRQEDCVYVDKTPMIAKLTTQAGAYFLSRPRRFGKSLLLDTIKELFEGNQSLFEGLYIYDKWDWSKTNPVIRIDFADAKITDMDKLNEFIMMTLESYQTKFNIICEETDSVYCFREQIIKAHEKFGQKVVILIDEYDKPILDNILNLAIADQIRESLKSFYSVMKAQDAHIQFILMTGVTKFSKVSLFSGVNQIQDITLHERYATICGYTHKDLETTFADHLAGVDWNKLRSWYNGYNFLGDSVYNPYDILLFIDGNQAYRSHWFETGNPSFLLKLFKQKQYFLPSLETLDVGEDILNSFDINRINPITLLFQTGYLTIKEARFHHNRMMYQLVIPNVEVRQALNGHFIDTYGHRPEEEKYALQDTLSDILMQADLTALEAHIKSIFAGIPWRNFVASEKKAAQDEDYVPLYESEGYYASVLYAFFASINATVTPEDISNKGQADMTIMVENQVYVMEFKLDTTKTYRKKKVNPALKQIQARGYSEKYLGQGKQVFEVGMIFNQTARNLVQMDWEVC
jgi:hypothetical protein